MLDRVASALGLMVVVLAAACTDPSLPSPTGQTPAASTSADARLVPVLEELEAHPEWTESQPAASVTATVPSLRYLCVAAQSASGSAIHVTVDVESSPWGVLAVAMFDDEAGPRVTYELEALAGTGDTCSFVIIGSQAPFPGNAADVEVNGPVDEAQAEAIRAAIHSTPERFGIERAGAPAVNVQPAAEPTGDIRCHEAVVYVGGPRASVRIGLQEGAAGWVVRSVRIIAQAIHPLGGPDPPAC